jgi:hypothetical protein
MTRTPIVDENLNPIVKPTAVIYTTPKHYETEQAESGVYAAYWQARSEFFHQVPK